jgi:hypothetical protein
MHIGAESRCRKDNKYAIRAISALKGVGVSLGRGVYMSSNKDPNQRKTGQ